MAVGLVYPNEKERLEDIESDYFQDLFHRSFFEMVNDNYVMHDLIHDLAQ